MLQYILVNKQPIPEPDPAAWAIWMSAKDTVFGRMVAQTQIDEIFVSTVFLGLDHGIFAKGLPVLFETMAFNGLRQSLLCERYTSWQAAQDGHDTICMKLRAEIEV